MEKIEIIDAIIRKIGEKKVLSDSEIQEYKEKISDAIDTLQKYSYLKTDKEIKLEMVSNPHDYGEILIESKKMKDDEGFTKEIYCVKNIIGNSTIGAYYNKDIKPNFSLGDVQISTMGVRRYNSQERNNEERFNKILVYIPEERYSQEELYMTYQELLYNEKLEEIDDKIQQNAQDLVNQIIEEVSKNYELSDSIIDEYRNKILECLKAEPKDIQDIARRGFWSKYDDFKLIITRDAHEYGKGIQVGEYDFKNSGEVAKVRSIIGDSNIGKRREIPDFSIGDIQICKRTMGHGYYGTYDDKNFSSEIILYIPEKEISEELYKKSVKTYKELLDLEEREKEEKIDKKAKEYSIELAEDLDKETNGRLTKEQIESIIYKLNIRKIVEWDSDYGIEVISDPDEFSKYLITDKDDNYETTNIVGDTLERN